MHTCSAGLVRGPEMGADLLGLPLNLSTRGLIGSTSGGEPEHGNWEVDGNLTLLLLRNLL